MKNIRTFWAAMMIAAMMMNSGNAWAQNKTVFFFDIENKIYTFAV